MKTNAGVIRSFVIPVPKTKLSQYQKVAKMIGKLWMEHGALSYIETVGSNLEAGAMTSFPRSVQLKKDEAVILGWSTFKSEAQSERIMKKVMTDKRLAPFMDPKKMLFDGRRMYWGGLKPFFQAYT